MNRINFQTLAVSLAVLTACTLDKGGDDTDSATSNSATDSASGPGPTTTDDPATTSSASTDATATTTTTVDATTSSESNKPCIDTPTVLAAEEASALGFSGAQLLVDKLGARSSMLEFANEPTTLADQWKGKALPITVELRHEGGEIRFIDAEPNPDYDDSGNESGFQECTDRLEIDVQFDFVTAAGELDEHRPAILSATTVERADLRLKLLPPGLMGSFDPTSLYSDPDWAVTGIEVFGSWQGTLAGGNLANEVKVGGNDGFIGFGSVAGWGDPGLAI